MWKNDSWPKQYTTINQKDRWEYLKQNRLTVSIILTNSHKKSINEQLSVSIYTAKLYKNNSLFSCLILMSCVLVIYFMMILFCYGRYKLWCFCLIGSSASLKVYYSICTLLSKSVGSIYYLYFLFYIENQALLPPNNNKESLLKLVFFCKSMFWF